MSRRHEVLKSLRVLDLGIITAGASTSAMLADLGADVVKIEGPSYFDPFRNWFGEANTPNWWNESPQFLATNRNKKSICLDLKSPRGHELFLALVKEADIVVENFRAGVLTRLGIDYDVLARANPAIILASISSQGATGPSAHAVSFGSTLEASSGMSYLTRYTDGAPQISGRALNYPDQVVALFAVGAILAAIARRRRTGKGAYLDLSQRELTTFLVGEATLCRYGSATPPNPIETCNDPQGLFATSDGRRIAVTIPRRVVDALTAKIASSYSSIDAWVAARTSAEALAELRAMGAAAEPIASGKDRGSDALAAGNAFAKDGNGRSVKGLPIRIGGHDLAPPSPAPSLGEHNRSVAEALGVGEEEYAALVAANVFATRPDKAVS
jgi:benzylsuccinate CoA-transferase BbsF subunit